MDLVLYTNATVQFQQHLKPDASDKTQLTATGCSCDIYQVNHDVWR